MLVDDLPAIAAEHDGEQVAIIFEGKTVRRRELRDRCWQLSNALTELASRGDRIGILASNCVEYVECSWGVPGAGMILQFLNWRLAARELTYVLNDAEPSVVLVEPRFLPILEEVLPQTPSVKHIVVIGRGTSTSSYLDYETLVARGAAAEPAPRGDESDIAWLLHTSGTTGAPKGAMLSHRNLLASMVAGAIGFDWQPNDVALFMMPQFHMSNYIFGVYCMRNIPVVIAPSFEISSYLEMVPRYAITTHAVAPTMLGMILDSPLTASADLSTLRTMIYGAAAMPVDTLRRAKERLPRVGFGGCYGMTELSGNVSYLGASEHEAGLAGNEGILLSTGRSLPGARIHIVNDDGTPAPIGTPGEIVVAGDCVLSGYWRNAAATAASFTGRWFHTGDIGRFDEAGRLYIVDRKKDMILTGGENVYPREVEEVLYAHPDIAEAAVVGLADPKWGERVVAVVCLRKGATTTSESIIEFCRPLIAGYKRPKDVLIRHELPKNAAGKILRRQLRDELKGEAT